MNESTVSGYNHINDQTTHNDVYQPGTPNVGNTSVLTNANNVCIKDSSFSITTNVNIANRPALEVLYQRVAPNAILNDGGRADDAKCHPGTREEVIGLIEDWAAAAEGDRILWLTGPAGGGKTAIMKTIAERSRNRSSHPTMNFFFFRGDLTRNSAQPVVPTLLYQLFQIHPDFADNVARMFFTHPRILDTSIAEQCRLISTLSSLIQHSPPTGCRVILLIDGLDECDVDPERSQGNILRALEGLVVENNSPFRLLVASRPEARIQMAFNQISHARTIFLDDQYRPDNDIRLFVTAEFNKIKASHPGASLLPLDWPSPLDIESIVTRSSGQFIYAATVMRYVSRPSVVPSLSLESVQGIIPAGNNSPFAYLDSIYGFILAQADDQVAVHDILSMQLLRIGTPGLMDLLYHYNSQYTQALVRSCTSDLAALVQLTGHGQLRFYHASLADFLVDRTRSATYWIDVDAFRAKVLSTIWHKTPIDTDAPYQSLQTHLFRKLESPSPAITDQLLDMQIPQWMLSNIDHYTVLVIIQNLYYGNDIDMYKHILGQLIRGFMDHGDQIRTVDIPFVAEYVLSYERQRQRDQRWWRRCFCSRK